MTATAPARRGGVASGAEGIRVLPVPLAVPVQVGCDLAALVLDALIAAGVPPQPWDVVVVTHKVVSKAEGRVVDLRTVEAGPRARALAAAGAGQGDARLVEVVLDESAAVVRAEGPVLVCETRRGLVCANAGVDRSNVDGGTSVTLLPLDPDTSAAALAAHLGTVAGGPVGVIVSDTFGRPFRIGGVNVAIGVAGMPAVTDHSGGVDAAGYRLRAGDIGTADEIAGIAEVVMGKVDGIPLAVVRGLRWEGEGSAADLQRPPGLDIFRRPPA